MTDRCEKCDRQKAKRVPDLAAYRGDRCDAWFRPDPDCDRLGLAIERGRALGLMDALRIVGKLQGETKNHQYGINSAWRSIAAEADRVIAEARGVANG